MMNMPLKRKSQALLSVALACIALLPVGAFAQTVQSRITQAINESQRTVLTGNTHPLAAARFDRGAAPESLAMDRMLLVLKRSPAQQAAVEKLVAEQQDRTSPNFHKWLTPEEFGQQFGPSDQDIATVRGWLESHGFVVSAVSKGRQVIEFSGTAGQVAEAFQAPIHEFMVNGEQHVANANDPSIPKAMASVVAGISSLNDFRPKAMSTIHKSHVASSGLSADASVKRQTTFQSSTDCGVTAVTNCFGLGPTDFAIIYNVQPLWNAGIDGTGQTIAIVSDSNINTADVADFRTIFGLPTNTPTVTVNGTNPGLTSDEVEAILDVEWSGSVAKNATINLVVSKNTSSTAGVNLSAQDIVDNKLGNIMSISFGECELGLGTAGNMFFNNAFSQAATEGITVLVSTGDNGSAGCDFFEQDGPVVQPAQFGLAVNGIGSTPFNVAVGGTEFNDISDPQQFFSSTNATSTEASALGYVPERTYNDSCADPIIYATTFGFATPQLACNDQTNVQPDGFVVTSGGSGGSSSCITDASGPLTCSGGYPKPSWQTSSTPADGARDLPDVSVFAGDGTVSGSFYVLCERDLNGTGSNTPCSLQTGAFLEAGGTSVSTQVFAGIMALVEQKYEDKQGLINPQLYTLAKASGNSCTSAANPAGTCMFYDVTQGTISMPCLTSPSPVNCAADGSAVNILPGYNAGAGYDLATGLGTVNAANLVAASSAWASTTSGNDFTLSAGSPTQVSSPGGTATVAITVNADGGFSGTVTFACSGLPSLTTCSAPSVNGHGQTTVTFQTTATTTSSIPAVRVVPPSSRIAPLLATALGLLFLAMAFLKGNRRWGMVFALLVMGVVFANVGCGGGGGGGGGGGQTQPGTPTGTTNVVVTATSGTIVRSVAVQLVVN
jgi:subtilase family serine protease